MTKLRAGVAQIDYTPQIGLPLQGNYRQDYAARGIHDPLKARGLVFTNDQRKVGLLQVDICMLGREQVAMMRNFIASRCDLRAEHILIAATHTHSGPAVADLGPLPCCEGEIARQFLQKAASAVVQANKRLQDVQLAIGHSREDRVSFNRRLKCKDGQTHMNWEGLDPDFVIEPCGPTDPELITMSLTQNGVRTAALINFALHPAVLVGDNWLYSADYPGYLAEALARIYGPDFIGAFFNGATGNVNHVDYTDLSQGRGYQMTQRIGYMLAIAAQQAIAAQRPVSGNQIAVSQELVALPHIKINEEDRQWCEDVIARAKAAPSPAQVDGLPEDFYAQARLALYQTQHPHDQVEVMVLRIGDVGIVGLPGEAFCQFGMQIKSQSPAADTIVIELANDAVGYLPTKDAFALGGYEPTPGSTCYEPGAGEKITASALAQLQSLFF